MLVLAATVIAWLTAAIVIFDATMAVFTAAKELCGFITPVAVLTYIRQGTILGQRFTVRSRSHIHEYESKTPSPFNLYELPMTRTCATHMNGAFTLTCTSPS